MELESARLIAGALALLPILGVGIGLGMIFSSYGKIRPDQDLIALR